MKRAAFIAAVRELAEDLAGRVFDLVIGQVEATRAAALGSARGQLVAALTSAPPVAEPDAAVRACRVCDCTEDDCSGCIERTGEPCWWIAADLCSACAVDVCSVCAAKVEPASSVPTCARSERAYQPADPESSPEPDDPSPEGDDTATEADSPAPAPPSVRRDRFARIEEMARARREHDALAQRETGGAK